jgi:5-methylcytosine-specific restriction endonuclease McrA
VCKFCKKEWVVKNNYNAESYSKNSDKLKVYQRNIHCKKNGIKGSFTLEQWLELKASYSNRCAYCGLESLNLEIEHFWPISLASKGLEISEFATNSIENIIPACTFCNHAKDYKPFIIFLGWKNNRLQ